MNSEDIIGLGIAYTGIIFMSGWTIWSYSKYGVIDNGLLEYIKLLGNVIF